MRGIFKAGVFALGVVSLVASSPGCALKRLKEENQRLKEANERLISRYNKLEQDLVNRERELANRNREVAGLRDQQDAVVRPASESSVEEFQRLGLESEKTDRGTVVRLDQAVFFPLGKAALSREGQRILAGVSRVLNDRYRNTLIRVEGHTDDVPVRKVRHLYPSNWELSTARACSVVRYLVQNGGVSPRRIYPAGFAYYRPRVAGSGASSRSKNRRVEILILNENA